ncbi:MAG: hypothetical protein BWY87_01538 [Deltaproteobacteria bacterium ADurb.Bin510]|nr:MAG: hypothetical protein BWY87_01538 [Deltaproteobacteria bacterium ADurb.Bin510]
MSRRSRKSRVFFEEIGPLMDDERDPLGRGLFLGRHTAAQLEARLEETGLLDLARARGYGGLAVTATRQDDLSRLYLSAREPAARLIELVLREALFRPRQCFVEGFDFDDGLSVLEVQWLCLQDPQASFSPERPRLPGQVCPGLGGLRRMHELLLGLAQGRDAVLNVPERYHTALIYAQEYHFFAPRAAGQLLALERDLSRWPLAEVSAAIEAGCLIDRDSRQPVAWQPGEQLAPVSARLRAYFASPGYGAAVRQAAQALHYTVDWGQYERITHGSGSE